MLGISGSLGAGGRIGSSKLMFGINEGSSGNFGGEGNSGMVGNLGKEIRTFPIGGEGRFGMFGRSTFAGWKLNDGIKISIPTLRFERSSVMSGILKFGIWRMGMSPSGQRRDSLQLYWS